MGWLCAADGPCPPSVPRTAHFLLLAPICPACLPAWLPACPLPCQPVPQDDKERLRAQVALASQGTGASEARLAEREEYIRQLQ